MVLLPGSFQTLGPNSVGTQQPPSAWALGLGFLHVLGDRGCSDREPECILPVPLPSHSFKTELHEPSQKGQPKQIGMSSLLLLPPS